MCFVGCGQKNSYHRTSTELQPKWNFSNQKLRGTNLYIQRYLPSSHFRWTINEAALHGGILWYVTQYIRTKSMKCWSCMIIVFLILNISTFLLHSI